MKKTLYLLSIVALVASCKQPESKKAASNTIQPSILFNVSDGSNISSFNVYRNDDIVLQLPASSAQNIDYDFDDVEMILEGLDSLKYTVEPLFMDSTNATVDIQMVLQVDDSAVVTQNIAGITYGQVAELNYTKK